MMGYIIKYIFSHESLYIICRICRSVEKVRILRSSTPSFYLFKTMYYNPVTTLVNSVFCWFKPQLLHKHSHFLCTQRNLQSRIDAYQDVGIGHPKRLAYK